MASERKQYTGEEKLAEAREARAHRRQSVHSERFSGPFPDDPEMSTACAA